MNKEEISKNLIEKHLKYARDILTGVISNEKLNEAEKLNHIEVIIVLLEQAKAELKNNQK